MINPLTPKNRVKIKLAHGTVALLLLGGIERGARAGGTGTLDHGSGWYPAGMKLVVRATPDPNSLFAGWQGQTNGSSVNGNEISWVVNNRDCFKNQNRHRLADTLCFNFLTMSFKTAFGKMKMLLIAVLIAGAGCV